MQPMSVFRERYLEMLEKDLLIFKQMLALTPEDQLNTYRDGGTGWTVLEVLCHLRDFEMVYYERSQLTLTQDFPALPFPDPAILAVERQYNTQQPSTVYQTWVTTRATMLELLRGVNDEDWERPANHPTRGRLTLNDQLSITCWHDINHLEQVMRILAEKQA